MPEQLILKIKNGVKLINVSNIAYIQSKKNYVYVNTLDKQSLIIRNTISNLERTLENDKFIRTHKSYLINIKCVINYCQETCCITLINNEKIPVSKRKRACLQDIIVQ